ncbi:MAG: DUF2075 domain-containing protein [Desulfosporosinus sp.]|nr:DUF2075 domain-containing protein [Desulfosporosinus sp.]
MEIGREDSSEPDLIIQIADRISGGSLILGLVGEGQEIYVGEEEGIKQWCDAIVKSNKRWKVVCPSKILNVFSGITDVEVCDDLDLNKSLRSNFAEDVTN